MNKVANSNQKMPKSVPQKKKKRAVSLNKKKERVGWLFVLPFVIGFVVLYIPIIFESIIYSFQKTQNLPGGAIERYFVGFENYNYALFTDPDYVQLMLDNIKQLFLDVPAIVIFSLFLAILLNQKMVGRAAFRAIFFIPVITSTGILELIDLQNSMIDAMESIDQIQSGADAVTGSATDEILQRTDISWLFRDMMVGQDFVDSILNIVNNVYSIVNRTGVQMLIFLAGLQSISPSIYESCYIEGASEWETFWKITIPMISPMILVNLIYTIIDSFTRQSNSVMSFISDTMSGLHGADGYPHGTAMAWIYFLLIILIIAAIGGIFSAAFVFYQRRER